LGSRGSVPSRFTSSPSAAPAAVGVLVQERIGAVDVELVAVVEAVTIGVAVERVGAGVVELFGVRQAVGVGVRVRGVGAGVVDLLRRR
jgi:hypothetical protein